MLELFRPLSLPEPQDYYSTPRQFSVEVVTSVCGSFTEGGNTFQLTLDPTMQSLLIPLNGVNHTASMEVITESAMRFYRTKGIKTWAFEEYLDALFMLRHEFANVWTATASGSICPLSLDKSIRHAEARRLTTELLGYGHALHFTAPGRMN